MTARTHLSLILAAVLVAQVLAAGVFELHLVGFTNAGSVLAGGQPCHSPCSTFFRVCLKNYQAVVSPGDCIFGSVLTPVLGSGSFAGTEGTGILLPLTFSWPGSFSLIIEAFYSPVADPAVDANNPERRLALFAIQRHLKAGHEWSQDVQTDKQTEIRYSYRFTCNENYYGESCTRKCAARDDHFGHYTCNSNGDVTCLPGWRGEYCQEPICLQGCNSRNGNCSKPGQCVCRDGWQGRLCDQCKKYPTCNHGTCQQPWQCNCEEGWGGLLCDQDLNYCTHHRPCLNGATCMNTGEGSYTCTCQPGFSGNNCELEMKECINNPCLNGGKCTELEQSYHCLCPPGTEGSRCEHTFHGCYHQPCFHNGTCWERDGGRSYTCECLHGFTGLNCERRVDRCTSLLCANGGECRMQGTRWSCICPQGFLGIRCERMAMPLMPAEDEESTSSVHWLAVSLGAVLVLLVLAFCAVSVSVHRLHRQRLITGTANNLSHAERDNLIPTSHLKNINKVLERESELCGDKQSHKDTNYHVDYKGYSSCKEVNEDPQQDTKHCLQKSFIDKIPLSRVLRESPECRISTINSPRDPTYQPVFLIAPSKGGVLATQV